MQEVVLKGYRLTEYEFFNRMPQGSTMKMGAKYNYNVKYTPDSTCRAEIGVEMADKEHPDAFRVRATMIGYFDVDVTEEKEKLHVATFYALFPVLRATVSVITAAAGIPPVLIPQIRIEDQDIYRFEVNPGMTGK